MFKAKKEYEVKNDNFEADKALRVAVYTRVSTNEQYLNWVWIESQKDTIMAEIDKNKDDYSYNENNNYYEDWGHSWAKEHRPELDRMIRDINNWEIDIIFVYKIDRLHRKLLALLSFIDGISKQWVFLYSIKDNIDTSDKMWMIMLQFMGIIWDIERENIRMRTIDWKLTKARHKYFVWWWKSAFWYDFVKRTDWTKVYVNTNEAKVVNRIFDLYVNKWKSLWEITRILESEWIPTRDDRLKDKILKANEEKENYRDKENIEEDFISLQKWTKKVNDWAWDGTTVRRILLNTMYIWYTLYWKTKKVWDKDKKKYISVKNDEKDIVEIPCDGLLDDISLFEKAWKLLEKNKNKKTKISPYLFSWLMICGACWYSYNWYKTTKKTFSYRCRWWMSWTKIKPPCKNSEISEELLFSYVWAELERNLSNSKNFENIVLNKDKNKETIRWLNRRLTDIWKLISRKENTLENAEKKEIEAINEKQRERYEALISDYLSEIRKLEVEEVNIKLQISNINSVDKKYKDVEEFATKHQKSFSKITKDKKKVIIKKYINKITKNLWKMIVDFNFIDSFDWKDWREWDEWKDKKLKSSADFLDFRELSPTNIIKRK